MRLSRKSSTSAALALCIVLSMFYYNIFHLISTVNLKSRIYEQIGHYNIVDNHREIKSYKESDGIKKIDDFPDNYDYKENDKNYELYESDLNLIHGHFSFMNSEDNIINERAKNKDTIQISPENDIIKENNIEGTINKHNINKQVKDDVKEKNDTRENINVIHKNNTENKVTNHIKESDHKIKNLNVDHTNNTIETIKHDLKEINNSMEHKHVNQKNNTEENVKNYMKEKEDKTEIINIILRNDTIKKVSMDNKEKADKIDKINAKHNNVTERKLINDIKEINVAKNNNKENNVTEQNNVKVDDNQVNIGRKINNHTEVHQTEKYIKFSVNKASVTTQRTNHVQVADKDFLINTPGCLIPDYGKTMVFNEAPHKGHTCGIRAVFIHKVDDDEIIFRIDENKMNEYKKGNQTYKCCYIYVSRPTSTNPGIQDTKAIYSPCVLFKNDTKIKLKQEVITVTCGIDPVKKTKIIYEDVYIIIKKVKKKKIKATKSWNVLILGMDTMSRARAYKNMPLTMKYFQQNDWLDYRGYQKVGYNTFPNLMALLTGKTNVYSACKPSMDYCNDLFIWTKYRNASYATAYGEDFLTLPDTFKNYGGFEIPPTDHYMRPFYLTGEHIAGNLVCTKKVPSAVHMLTYANHLAETYKDNNFFGMFWMNSYSHNDFNTPALFDNYTRHFFENLSMTGAMNNTFIIFLSDHGIRYGEMRYSMESYYEERLPMFYMWVPLEFRKDYAVKYNSLKVNQHRLTTPYDLHATLWDILKMSRDSVTVIKPEACPNCTSLFEEKSIHRTCAEAAVDKKWCSCHKLEPVDLKNAEGTHCLELAVSSIQNITKDIKTIECTRCSKLRLKKALRLHSYYNNANNKTYFVVAFLLSPGDVGYEVTIEKDNTGYNIVTPTTTITAYNTRGDCTVKKLTDRPYCVCEKIPKCHKKHKR